METFYKPWLFSDLYVLIEFSELEYLKILV